MSWSTVLPTHGGPLRGFFLYLCILATRKPVNKFFQTHLLHNLIFFQLPFDVFLYLLFVTPYCLDVVFSCPEMPISIFVFQIGVSVENH